MIYTIKDNKKEVKISRNSHNRDEVYYYDDFIRLTLSIYQWKKIEKSINIKNSNIIKIDKYWEKHGQIVIDVDYSSFPTKK